MVFPLKIYLLIIYLTNYFIAHYPIELVTNEKNNENRPKTIYFDLFNKRKYEQYGNLNVINAFKFLFPGNIEKRTGSRNDVIIESNWYSKYGFGIDTSSNIVRKENDYGSYEEYESYCDENNTMVEGHYYVTTYLGKLDFTWKKKGYKYLFFTTCFDPIFTSRLDDGMLGFAKFQKHKNKWILDDFKPAISAFGYYGYATMPQKIIPLNESEIAFYGKVINDDGPKADEYEPRHSYSFLLVKKGKQYKRILIEGCTDLIDDNSKIGTLWKSNIKTDTKSISKGFYDIILEIKGVYDPEHLSGCDYELLLKNKSKHNFKLVLRFKYNGKEYVKAKSEVFE